jgi:choline dehydrogenase-like flavoprotein
MHTNTLPDVIIVGSGVGGGTAALRLAEQGLNVHLLERGEYLPKEADNWSTKSVYIDKKYTAYETWLDGNNKAFNPSVFYNVGGASKFFGATMIRFRESDFDDTEHYEGVSPAWPITYDTLEPYYERAEYLFHTMGSAGMDPTEPYRANAYPYPGVKSDPAMESLVERFRSQGLQPFPQQAAIHMPPNGACVRCETCDGYPCKIGAKADAEKSVIEPALATNRVQLMTGVTVRRVLLSADGRKVNGLEVERSGNIEILRAKIYILSASAINSAAILLRSACDQAPGGVANSSGVVGRFYMAHNNTALMAAGLKKNPTIFQKTVTINDYYYGDGNFPFPMGCIISLGKLRPGVMAASNPMIPYWVNKILTDRSFDWWVMSEDLPDPNNRITISGKEIKMDIRRNNLLAHFELISRAKSTLRRAGLPLIFHKLMPVATTSHQCGTVRFGNDPAKAALDQYCRSFDHDNLFVVDSSFFPSSAAVNPALTIAAQALRVADHICQTEFGNDSSPNLKRYKYTTNEVN